jgi:hypothetical protein
MANYTMYCNECEHTYGISFSISQFDKLMAEEKAKPCPSCNKLNTITNLIRSSQVVLRGDGWVGKIGSSGSQSRVDAALAENDRLMDAPKTDKRYREKEDQFKRKEEQAKNMAEKANGVAL